GRDCWTAFGLWAAARSERHDRVARTGGVREADGGPRRVAGEALPADQRALRALPAGVPREPGQHDPEAQEECRPRSDRIAAPVAAGGARMASRRKPTSRSTRKPRTSASRGPAGLREQLAATTRILRALASAPGNL